MTQDTKPMTLEEVKGLLEGTTPGPWESIEYSQRLGGGCRVAMPRRLWDPSRRIVAEAYAPHIDGGGQPAVDAMTANARLIAAAPALAHQLASVMEAARTYSAQRGHSKHCNLEVVGFGACDCGFETLRQALGASND